MTDEIRPTSPPHRQRANDADIGLASAMLSLFPTLVVNHRLPNVDDMNAALTELVRRTATHEPSHDTSNVGGYHSGPDFINHEADCVRALRERLQASIVELTKLVLRPTVTERKIHFELEGWANLLRHGDYQAVHSHPNRFWSGTYYLADNETVAGHPLSGKLELIDPRAGAAIADPRETTLYGRYLVDPRAGQLIVFPAWLSHCVHSYFGPGERISIGFNVDFELRP